ncbi:DNA-3-methyladenine glycosylase [Candidatus Parcubacteria bacterium]|nr:MAG: DNA-3-methyladenine glycosylase [Candidatus Parcubacteria bacterium]
MSRPKEKFFLQPTIKVARKLLGSFLIRKIGNKTIIGKIVETEAYCGTRDLASHAAKGKTPRTEIMFGPAGYAYIYLIYGMYFCLNIVTEKKDYPAAVLIRALQPIKGIKTMENNRKLKLKKQNINELKKLCSGPGKLCQALGIDKSLNKENLIKSKKLLIKRGANKIKIVSASRIGVDYAGKYKDKKWRFYVKDNPYISSK